MNREQANTEQEELNLQKKNIIEEMNALNQLMQNPANEVYKISSSWDKRSNGQNYKNMEMAIQEIASRVANIDATLNKMGSIDQTGGCLALSRAGWKGLIDKGTSLSAHTAKDAPPHVFITGESCREFPTISGRFRRSYNPCRKNLSRNPPPRRQEISRESLQIRPDGRCAGC
jgi:hypothetical protein